MTRQAGWCLLRQRAIPRLFGVPAPSMLGTFLRADELAYVDVTLKQTGVGAPGAFVKTVLNGLGTDSGTVGPGPSQ